MTIRKIRIASNKKHSIPKTGSSKRTTNTCSTAKINEKVKPKIAGTILNVNHTIKINMEIENKALTTLPPFYISIILAITLFIEITAFISQ